MNERRFLEGTRLSEADTASIDVVSEQRKAVLEAQTEALEPVEEWETTEFREMEGRVEGPVFHEPTRADRKRLQETMRLVSDALILTSSAHISYVSSIIFWGSLVTIGSNPEHTKDIANHIRADVEETYYEHETPELKVARVNTMLDTLASDVRQDPELQALWQQEKLELVAETLENYDVGSLYKFVADEAGLETDVVANSSDIRGVYLYTNETVASAVVHHDELIREHRMDSDIDELSGKYEEIQRMKKWGGFHIDGYVFLNLSEINAQSSDLSVGMANTLDHEFVHAFDNSQLHDWNEHLAEGMTEFVADRYRTSLEGELHGDFPAYVAGNTASAAILEASLGQERRAFYRAVALGDLDGMQDVYDQQYGEGSLTVIQEVAIEGEGIRDNEAWNVRFAPGYWVLGDIEHTHGKEKVQTVVREVNERLAASQGEVLFIQEGNVMGGLLISDAVKDGIVNGQLIEMTEDDARFIVFGGEPTNLYPELDLNLQQALLDQASGDGDGSTQLPENFSVQGQTPERLTEIILNKIKAEQE